MRVYDCFAKVVDPFWEILLFFPFRCLKWLLTAALMGHFQGSDKEVFYQKKGKNQRGKWFQVIGKNSEMFFKHASRHIPDWLSNEWNAVKKNSYRLQTQQKESPKISWTIFFALFCGKNVCVSARMSHTSKGEWDEYIYSGFLVVIVIRESVLMH